MKIRLEKYNPEWQLYFKQEQALIQGALGAHAESIYHIGSTSVVGLSAKPQIDILCVIDRLDNFRLLEEVGYIFKGEYNVPMRYVMSKNQQYAVNLHITTRENNFIQLNLIFRDYLRKNNLVRMQYQDLKEKIAQDPNSGEKIEGAFTNYTLQKNDFIKDVLDRAGFDGLCLNFCTHYREWERYHRIREEENFDQNSKVKYDRKHPTIRANNHYHFILYKGTEIVSAAHIEFITSDVAVLRTLATEKKSQSRGYGKYMMQRIESWLRLKGAKEIKMHARLDAEGFYRKLGYKEVEFNDPSILREYVDLGKRL